MKISIDTKEDSIEDIRKVVAILSGIIEKKGMFEPAEKDAPVASMFGMFDNAINRAKEEEEKEKTPRIIQY